MMKWREGIGLFGLLLFAVFDKVHSEDCRKKVPVYDESFKPSCEESKCLFDIPPVASEVIRLEIELNPDHTGYVELWETLVENGQSSVILAGNFSKPDDVYYYTSSAGSGLSYQHKNYIGECNKYDLPKVIYSRFDGSKKESWCGKTVNFIGDQVTVVQTEKIPRTFASCPYRLFPKNGPNSDETLYLLISSREESNAIYFVEKNETELYESNIFVSENWKTLDFLTTASRDYTWKPETMLQIEALSTTRNCSCGTRTISLSSLSDSISLRSPGYPDFSCPGVRCAFRIKFPSISVPSEFFSQVLVSMHSVSRKDVNLGLDSNSSSFIFNSLSFTNLDTSALLDENDLRIYYETPPVFSTSFNGHFEINVSRVLIQKDCDCTTFLQKRYNEPMFIEMILPPECEVMYCDWNADFPSKKQVNITLENGNDDDEVHVWSHGVMEVYKGGDDLKYQRTLFLLTYNSWAHVSFFRKSKGVEGAKLTLFVSPVRGTTCSHTKKVDVTTTPEPITSSNYPAPYKNLDVCQYVLTAPKNFLINVFVAEVQTEKMHDRLSFYDGSSSKEKMIKQFTGRYHNEIVASTGNKMFVIFEADNQNTRRGYHFVVFAVPFNSSRLPSSALPSHSHPEIPATSKAVTTTATTTTTSRTTTKTMTDPSTNAMVTPLTSVEPKNTNEMISILPYFLALVLLIVVIAVALIVFLFIRKRKISASSNNSNIMMTTTT